MAGVEQAVVLFFTVSGFHDSIADAMILVSQSGLEKSEAARAIIADW